jgi:hypothetical protein
VGVHVGVCMCAVSSQPLYTHTAAPIGTSSPAPLEVLRVRWQTAAEALCAARGYNPSLLGVVVSECAQDDIELPPGCHKLKQARCAAILGSSAGASLVLWRQAVFLMQLRVVSDNRCKCASCVAMRLTLFWAQLQAPTLLLMLHINRCRTGL